MGVHPAERFLNPILHSHSQTSHSAAPLCLGIFGQVCRLPQIKAKKVRYCATDPSIATSPTKTQVYRTTHREAIYSTERLSIPIMADAPKDAPFHSVQVEALVRTPSPTIESARQY